MPATKLERFFAPVYRGIRVVHLDGYHVPSYVRRAAGVAAHIGDCDRPPYVNAQNLLELELYGGRPPAIFDANWILVQSRSILPMGYRSCAEFHAGLPPTNQNTCMQAPHRLDRNVLLLARYRKGLGANLRKTCVPLLCASVHPWGPR
jgi:hypothetical protein